MNKVIRIDKSTAARFLLLKQGLFKAYLFEGKRGALDYVRQAGCIQYDPVDVVGKNAELTLQSRVKGFRKKDLYDLLYKERKLFDYTDKELSILPIEDWPYFERYRRLSKEKGKHFEGLNELEEEAKDYIRKHGPVSSSSLPIKGEIRWHSSIHWSGSWEGNPTRASRSVLEQLYTTGELVIHHKEKTRKFYDLAERRLPLSLLEQKDPLPDDFEHIKWRILRRISAVGLLWERNSPAFLGIPNLNTEKRKEAFDQLCQEEKITVVEIEGIRYPFYICQQDRKLLEAAKEEGKSSRLEFLAPLDPMLWDRDLIKAVFGFDYSWEIYIPKEKRRYGYYVLPVLYGQRFIGRMEPILKDGRLEVKGLWLEKGVRKSKKLNRALNARLKRFAKFNGVVYEDEDLMEKVKR